MPKKFSIIGCLLLNPCSWSLLITPNRQSHARIVIEMAFWLWKLRFGIFKKKLELNLSTANLAIYSTMLMHNFLLDNENNTYDANLERVMQEQAQDNIIHLPQCRTAPEIARRRDKIAE